jgi:hypothetical protein
MKLSAEDPILLKENPQKIHQAVAKETYQEVLEDLRDYLKNGYLVREPNHRASTDTLNKFVDYEAKDDKNSESEELRLLDVHKQDQNNFGFHGNFDQNTGRSALLPNIKNNANKSNQVDFEYQYQDTRRILPSIDRLSVIPEECKQFHDINKFIAHSSITQVVFTPRKKEKIFEKQKIRLLEGVDLDFDSRTHVFLNNQELEQLEVGNNNYDLKFIGNG